MRVTILKLEIPDTIKSCLSECSDGSHVAILNSNNKIHTKRIGQEPKLKAV